MHFAWADSYLKIKHSCGFSCFHHCGTRPQARIFQLVCGLSDSSYKVSMLNKLLSSLIPRPSVEGGLGTRLTLILHRQLMAEPFHIRAQ